MTSCVLSCLAMAAVRVAALDDSDWENSTWITVPDAPVAGEAECRAWITAPGTSWFAGRLTNADEVVSATWMTTGLGIYELYLNGTRIGDEDALKPGFTHRRKTRRSFAYDVTPALRRAKNAENVLAAEVSSGWWRDHLAEYFGQKSAFRSVLKLTYANGTTAFFGTDTNHWTCAVGGPVKRAGIFDGESYDARIAAPVMGGDGFKRPEVSTEFAGEILPTDGAEVCRRHDLALTPVEAYNWKDTTGASSNAFGKVVKTRTFDPKGTLHVAPGETLVVDFGQNCAAVPSFEFTAEPGVTLTCLPGEMLNDTNGEKARGNDGPAGSVYRANLRIADTGMRLEYTFATDKAERYLPRHTYFGYRYISITATGAVTIRSIRSIPVTSITRAMELGKIETGDASVNRLIANARWGQLSNFLSIPTDCPQRNERAGWTGDAQVFCETSTFNADTARFFRKWTRDLRDSQRPEGGYTCIAPCDIGFGSESLRHGWNDAGIIVPYQVWKQFGDTAIVEENWQAMAKMLDRQAATKADHAANAELNQNGQFGDWLSFEDYASCGGTSKAYETVDGKRRIRPNALVYWNYLNACYWLWDARMMADMARGTGRSPAKWTAMAAAAKTQLRMTCFEKDDGMILRPFRQMQTPALFALKLGLVEGEAAAKTLAAFRANVAEHGGCLTTGFLGTSILLDTLTECGASDLAYDLLLNHAYPSWLYSVDQGATTIWERWNGYTKEKGFGPVGMNSFNHYAYGSVLAWIYKHAAGIAADPTAPGFKAIAMRPVPDRRLGFVKAEYKSAAGLIRSAWRYEGDKWIWNFTIPEGAVARVILPGETAAREYPAGTYEITR